MDIDDLLPGQRFDKKLAEALAACEVLIAVIGPRWIELLRAREASRDLDYVRMEIDSGFVARPRHYRQRHPGAARA
jgi:hypothetical protein